MTRLPTSVLATAQPPKAATARRVVHPIPVVVSPRRGGGDPLWLAFGLNEPGATNLPDSADGLVLTAGPAGTVLAHWSTASRATRYRVFKQIDGVDAIQIGRASCRE